MRTTAMAHAAPRNAAAAVATSGLCGCLHVGPTRRRSAARPAGATRQWSNRTRAARVCRVPARQSPRLHILGSLSEQPSPAAAATDARPDARSGPHERGAPGWLEWLLLVRLSHAYGVDSII